MNKVSACLFLLAALVNVGVGLLISHTAGFMLENYQNVHEAFALPLITVWILSYAWWPFVFAGLCAIGCVASIGSKTKRRPWLLYALSMLLVVEVAGLALTAFALCLPLYITSPAVIP